jgi:hypothetical protein
MPKQKTLQKIYRRTKRGMKTLRLKTMSKKDKIAELKTLSKNGLLDLIILICEMLKKNIHNPHGKKEPKQKRKGTVKVKGKTKYLNNNAGKKARLAVFKKLARANVQNKRWSKKTATQAIRKTKRKLGVQ